MKDWQDLVCEFHKKNCFEVNSYDLNKHKAPRWVLWFLKISGYMVYGISKVCLWVDKLAKLFHHRHFLLFRTHIIIEELGETIIGIANSSEIEVADGIADSIYVLLGLAVQCNLPIDAVIKEVRRSNLTKGFYIGIEGRIKELYKGKNYSPPDIRWAIHEGRKKKIGGTKIDKSL